MELTPLFILMFEQTKVTMKVQWVMAKKEKLDKKRKPISNDGKKTH